MRPQIIGDNTPSLSEIQGPSQELSFHKNFRSAIRNFVLVETKSLRDFVLGLAKFWGCTRIFARLSKIRSNFRPKKSRNFARNIDEFSVEQ